MKRDQPSHQVAAYTLSCGHVVNYPPSSHIVGRTVWCIRCDSDATVKAKGKVAAA